eukprot:Phypoly_transcript_18051.p1 GENE.Phypoly_transcript_18051~~Phypoly_transcript_18051.p1  ORF type:complete len:109 (+),score=14.30 Phypoly_transcript_18051:230-556(+)
MFEAYLETQRNKYTEGYHFVGNNCNHFTNECSRYLLGKDIPFHISGLPEEVINTPFGINTLMPMIERFFITGDKPDLKSPLVGAVMDLYLDDAEQENLETAMFGFYPS